MPSITHDQSMDSISDSIVHIGDNEIKECAIEALEPFKNELEAQGFNLNELGTSELIKTWSNIERFKDTKLNNDTELKDASDFTDLITGKIAGFDEEKLREMCTFSKISYGNVDEKLEKDGYKTRRQLEKEGYKIIKFYDNDLIQDQYCSDDGYKLKSQDVGYALKGNNSYNRDAGYIFIKGNEVTIAYHGTRDLNDVKEDLRASLAQLSFLPKDHRVHSGFYSLFKRSWPSVHKILQGHANDQGISIENLKINVTGHSMGGAIASIAALCLNKIEGAKDVHVATFGSPRVFYNGAAEVYNECLGNNTIRVACQSDLVPCLPHGNAGMHYKHVGKPLKLKTDKTLEYLEPHYHKIDTYYDLIKNVQQENFKSDNNTSKYFYIAYVCSIFYNAVLPYADVDDKEFFKKVEEENKDIKFSEIPAQYPPNLEEKFRQGEQEVAQLTNDKTQLEERLNSIQQSLAEKTEEFKSTQIQLEQERSSVSERLTQEQQKVIKLNSQVTKLTEEFKGIKDQLIEKEAELGKYNKTNAELEGKNSNLTNQLEELQKAEKDLKKNVDNLNNNEESNNKNENFLRAKKQVIYAAVSFASSTALAVSASLTIFHLAICISLAVTALTFLAVGCYCSYKANTALNNVKIENDSYRIAA